MTLNLVHRAVLLVQTKPQQTTGGYSTTVTPVLHISLHSL